MVTQAGNTPKASRVQKGKAGRHRKHRRVPSPAATRRKTTLAEKTNVGAERQLSLSRQDSTRSLNYTRETHATVGGAPKAFAFGALYLNKKPTFDRKSKVQPNSIP